MIANAETDASVDGTTTLSAGGGVDRAAELQGRSVFVVATGDDEEFVQTVRDLHENAPEPKELVEYGRNVPRNRMEAGLGVVFGVVGTVVLGVEILVAPP